jgi:hypothetical protein
MAKPTKHTLKETIPEGEVVKTRTEESLDVLVGQLESALPQQFSDKHIDRYFDNREKLYKYIRDDHKDEKELIKNGRKYTAIYMTIGGIILAIFMVIIVWANKDLLGKFLELFFAFIGGTGVGSVLTNKFGSKNE